MGLKNFELVWHPQGNDGWLARLEHKEEDTGKIRTTYRFAHVNIYSWSVKRVKGKVLVDMQFGHTPDMTWHDSIDAAKLHVEALYALYD
ncbi:hypothetical protein UFOVP232_12 [uncultured Caudovirales phage]|jgi:hypothetical protein|uniref:Uncharacterized protein n=1 Tax=uncultured Caudovirales phage TaxID=2100421 RepID=A0A6J7WT33_9CAUD|nr:hypothetical protein UFOVP232_12 [uncultured Caudovirales phage]